MKRVLWWCGVAPALFVGWSVIAGMVHFVDEIQFVLSTVTEESVADFTTKMEALWLDYEERMGVE